MKGLILAGGYGSRLRPLTHTGPKQLIPIANKPVLFYAIEDLKEAGITDIGIVLGFNMPEKIKETVGNGSKFGVKVTYIMQGEPKGIAHAIKVSQSYLKKEPFVVYLGDNILKNGIKDLAEDFKKSKADSVIALSKVKNPGLFGVAELDKNGNVKTLVEKPKKPKTNLALVGIYLFNSKVFEVIKKLKPSWRDELEITDAIQQLIDLNCKVNAHIVKGWWKDTGKPEDILHANHLILEDIRGENKGQIEENVTLRGRVVIGKGTVIKKSSVIRGPAVIGENCEIGPNTYIGPYTSIGDNTVIIGGEIESSIVVGNCFINCGKKIVDSLIGANSRITSAEKTLPRGYTLILGEHSEIGI